MYHPYFRGKQYELITIRENAQLLAGAGFTPIIEPVRETLGGLERTLNAVCDVNGAAIVIVNPYHGDHSLDGVNITALLQDKFVGHNGVSAGILLTDEMSVADAINLCEKHDCKTMSFIHAGFSSGKALASELGGRLATTKHIFFPQYDSLYRRHFSSSDRILLTDGFKRRRNRDYPLRERFSALHITYEDAGMEGFGDFLIVGDEYSESGGPAYAIAIHLTYIDEDEDDVMFVYHFVSERQDSPTDPAGKFGEALNALIKKIGPPNSHVFESEAVKEFRELHRRKHYPGLGYIKKLSMQHHIETLAHFFS